MGLRGQENTGAAIHGEMATIKVLNRVVQNPSEFAARLAEGYKGSSPTRQAELQGMIVGRFGTAALVTAGVGPIGVAVSGLAVGGNAVNAGTTYRNEIDIVDAIIYGESP